jgi:hypothetical protein
MAKSATDAVARASCPRFTILVDPREMGSWEHFTGAQVAREVARILSAALDGVRDKVCSADAEVIDWTGNADDRDPRLDKQSPMVQRSAYGLVTEALRRLRELNFATLPLAAEDTDAIIAGDNGVDEGGAHLARPLADALWAQEAAEDADLLYPRRPGGGLITCCGSLACDERGCECGTVGHRCWG